MNVQKNSPTPEEIEADARAEVLDVVNDKREERQLPPLTAIPDEQWRRRDVRPLVAAYIGGDRGDFTEIQVDEIATLIEVGIRFGFPDVTNFPGPGRPPGTPQYDTFAETEQEIACREAAADFIIRRLNTRIDVKLLRLSLPNGALLETGEEMVDLLSSRVAKFFTFEQLREWDICPLNTEAEIVSQQVSATPEAHDFDTYQIRDGVNRALSASVRVTIKMKTRKGEIIERTANHPMKDHMMFRQSGPGQYYVSWNQFDTPAYFQPVKLENGFRVRFIEGFKDSAVGQSLLLSRTLGTFLEWDTYDVLLFLFLGVAFEKGCMTAQMRTTSIPRPSPYEYAYGPVEMVFHPWLQLGSIARIYRVIQARAGAKNRLPMPDHIEAFRFVNRKLDELNEDRPTSRGLITFSPTWGELHQMWKKEHPGDKRDHRNFRRDYMETKRTLFPPRSFGG